MLSRAQSTRKLQKAGPVETKRGFGMLSGKKRRSPHNLGIQRFQNINKKDDSHNLRTPPELRPSIDGGIRTTWMCETPSCTARRPFLRGVTL